MKIRDGNAEINGDKTVYELPSGNLDVVADDGRTIYNIRLSIHGELTVRSWSVVKHGGRILDTQLLIRPIASNVIEISLPEYK